MLTQTLALSLKIQRDTSMSIGVQSQNAGRICGKGLDVGRSTCANRFSDNLCDLLNCHCEPGAVTPRRRGAERTEPKYAAFLAE